mgnify:CR=1 FL=1
MMIEIAQFGLMLAADINHRNGRISQIVRGRFPARDRRGAHRQQHAAGKKLVFVRTTGMGDDEGIFHG